MTVHYRLSLMVLLLVLDLTWRTDGMFWMGALCWSPGLTSSLPTALLLRRKCLEPWKSSEHWEPLDRWGRSANRLFCLHKASINQSIRGRISSVGRARDFRAGGRGFDSRGRTISQGLKIIEKWRYYLCTVRCWTFAWLEWLRKMVVPSPVGEVKYSVPN